MPNFQATLTPLVPPNDPSKAVTAETLFVTDAAGNVLGMIPNDQLLDVVAFAIDDPATAALVAGFYAVDSNIDGDFDPAPVTPLTEGPVRNVSRSGISLVRLPDTSESRRGIFRSLKR